MVYFLINILNNYSNHRINVKRGDIIISQISVVCFCTMVTMVTMLDTMTIHLFHNSLVINNTVRVAYFLLVVSPSWI